MKTPKRHRRTDAADPVRVQRHDRAQMLPAERTRDNLLRTQAMVAVPGVMEYEAPDGSIVLELIPEEELHDPESLHSLASVPVTLTHPPEDVTPENTSTYGVGDVGEDVTIIEDTGHVRIGIVLRRHDVLAAVDRGMTEISPGYTCLIDPTPGVHPKFGRYDAIQRDRRYNHVAVVDEARGGPSIHLRADGRWATKRLDAKPQPHTPPTGGHMNPLLLMLAATIGVSRLDEAGADLPEDKLAAAIADAIRNAQAEAEVPEGEMTPEAMKAKIAQLEGELAAMQKAEGDRADQEEEAEELEARKTIDAIAEARKVDMAKWTDKTTSAERRLDVARAAGHVEADKDPGEDYVRGVIGMLAREDSKRTRDPFHALKTDEKPPKKPAEKRDDGLSRSPDPFRDNLAKRQDDATR